MTVHLLLIGALWFIVLKPRFADFEFVTTLVQDGDNAQFEAIDFPVDVAAPDEGPRDDVPLTPLDAVDAIGMGSGGSEISVDGLTGTGIAGTGTAGKGQSGSGAGAGNANVGIGFSDVAASRLKRHSSVKQGNYEIALFWDGPSDLDVHVYFQTPTGTNRRVINYVHMGNPANGYLDLDQNASQPLTDEPIEHIRWNNKKLPNGFYQILVHGYELRAKQGAVPERVSYVVEVKTPEGVKSYRGAVAQNEFNLVETMTIGRVADQFLTVEAQATRLVETAQQLLAAGDEDMEWVPGLLLLVIRRFPTTDAAQQARELLQGRAFQ